jgi:dephospho-CoA kinase
MPDPDPPADPDPTVGPDADEVDGARRPVIGVTGAIGGGKSTVAAILARLGCVVSDSDAEARAVLDEPDVRARLAEWWGRGVLDEAGEVDRAAVARIVFGDPEQRRRLESLVHPRVHAQRRRRFAAAPPEAPALVMDVPLLFEAGLDAECDAVVFVDASFDVRADRVARSRGWSRAELARREASQMPLDEKRRRADHVIVNEGAREALEDRVRELLRSITTTFTD